MILVSIGTYLSRVPNFDIPCSHACKIGISQLLNLLFTICTQCWTNTNSEQQILFLTVQVSIIFVSVKIFNCNVLFHWWIFRQIGTLSFWCSHLWTGLHEHSWTMIPLAGQWTVSKSRYLDLPVIHVYQSLHVIFKALLIFIYSMLLLKLFIWDEVATTFIWSM